MNKFIKVFLLFITSITLSSCTVYKDEIPQDVLTAPEKWIDAPSDDENNKLKSKVAGLKAAKRKYEVLLQQAKNEPMEWKEDGLAGLEWDYVVKKVPESQIQYIEDRIYELDNQIYEMEYEMRNNYKKKAEENDSLDEANQELDSLNFGNNNENKFDDVENPNENIFQSPQTPSTPSMPETFSSPGSSYEGG